MDNDTMGDDLMLGAGPIAKYDYGRDDAKARRNVYRNPLKPTFFKHGNFVAALKSTIHREVAEREGKARKAREVA
jgi:hypothetical protein